MNGSTGVAALCVVNRWGAEPYVKQSLWEQCPATEPCVKLSQPRDPPSHGFPGAKGRKYEVEFSGSPFGRITSIAATLGHTKGDTSRTVRDVARIDPSEKMTRSDKHVSWHWAKGARTYYSGIGTHLWKTQKPLPCSTGFNWSNLNVFIYPSIYIVDVFIYPTIHVSTYI